MKILFGMPSKDSWGGPISSEPPFVKALKKLDIECFEEVYVYGDKDKPTPLLTRIRRVLETAFRFRRFLKKQQVDLIHLNTAFDSKTILRDSISLFIFKPKKTKVFFKVHGSEAEKFEKANFIFRFLINFIKNRVDGFGVHSTEEKENFLRLGFDESKFYFVKNAVTIHENLENNFSRLQKTKDEVFHLLFVSRFIEAKGLIETIHACSIIKNKGFKFKLTCVGDGEVREFAEREVERLNLQDSVKFTGYISEDEVTKYFFNSDLFIFPTNHGEGFPNVLFKAVAVGLPIVTTKIRAADEYLKNKENCLFCTKNPENIGEKVHELLSNAELRQTISQCNLEFGKLLLPKNIAHEFLDIYKKMLEK